MSISMIGSLLGGASAVSGAGSTRQNSPSPGAAQSELQQIREKGLTAWAHEKKMEALKERIREQLMAERGVTKEGVAALPEADRTSVENEIARLVEERLQQTMEAQAEEAAQGGKTEGVLLNIMV